MPQSLMICGLLVSRPGAEGVEISLNMEQQTLDDFDIHAFILAKSSLQVHIELHTAVAGGDSVEVDFLAQVLTAESQEAPAGNQTWSLGAVVIFPEVGSDEGGLVPVSDTFTLTYRTTD